MRVHANVMVKDEAILLPVVYEYWKDYPIDHWVFYDDNSTDNTKEIIKEKFGDKSTILNSKRKDFSESRNRSSMLEHSRSEGADFVVCIDADELMASNLVENFDEILQINSQYDLQYYWFNVVGEIGKIRQDPSYRHNFRTFILPMKNTGEFDLSLWQYHTPRTPPISLPGAQMRQTGFIHLQAINRKFYALKQLWYKHVEHLEYKHPIEHVNLKYDSVVNYLNFNEIDIPSQVVGDIKIDPSVYDELAEIKGYKSYIEKNKVEGLITFGEEYL